MWDKENSHVTRIYLEAKSLRWEGNLKWAESLNGDFLVQWTALKKWVQKCPKNYKNTQKRVYSEIFYLNVLSKKKFGHMTPT